MRSKSSTARTHLPSTSASMHRTMRWGTWTPRKSAPWLRRSLATSHSDRRSPRNASDRRSRRWRRRAQVTLADPRVEQPALHRYYLVPLARTAAADESPVLDVLGQLMGGGVNSYQYRSLVIDEQLAVTVAASYHSAALDPSPFRISAIPKPGVKFDQIEHAIDELIADIAHNTPSTDDLERVKTRLIAHAIYAEDDQEMVARWYGRGLTTGLCIDDIRGWPDGIRAVVPSRCARMMIAHRSMTQRPWTLIGGALVRVGRQNVSGAAFCAMAIATCSSQVLLASEQVPGNVSQAVQPSGTMTSHRSLRMFLTASR
ncbi:hypothetical protein AB7M49_004087 [Bradyrhizobium elkanii]